MTAENNYLELLSDVLTNGEHSENRTGVDTFKVFGRFWECDDVLTDFPLLTTKRVFWPAVVTELLWFLRGDTNVSYLQENGVHIWDEWADEDGELGPVYGAQWRRWFGGNYYKEGELVPWLHDQIANAERLIREDPNSRRILVSAWNVGELGDMRLQPCHYAFQLQVQGQTLNMVVNMRSTDIFLGMPFNIASYALLLMMFAKATGYRPKRLCFSLGDLHLYQNHISQAQTQLSRTPRTPPVVEIAGDFESVVDVDRFNIQLMNYNPYPALPAKVAV